MIHKEVLFAFAFLSIVFFISLSSSAAGIPGRDFQDAPPPPPDYLNHSICDGNLQCVVVRGAGESECSTNQDCLNFNHSKCDNNLRCIEAPGRGENRCGTNEDCTLYEHTECNSWNPSQCVTLPGFGTNICTNDLSCQFPSHLSCEGYACTAVYGEGGDECSSMADCGPTHAECDDDLICQIVPGEGDSHCYSDSDCQTWTHGECGFNAQCVSIPGIGESDCASNADCREFHTECTDYQCIQVEGPGEYECTLDSDCYTLGCYNMFSCGIVETPRNPTETEYRVFTTSQSWNGNLGGLSGADQKCQDAANNANLGGSWKAWLSDSATSAADRLYHSRVPYVNLNGIQIADNWNDLTDGTLDDPIRFTELGTYVSRVSWTGTNQNGNGLPENCLDWYSAENSSSGWAGSGGLTDSGWTNVGHYLCSSIPLHIHCFEQPTITNECESYRDCQRSVCRENQCVVEFGYGPDECSFDRNCVPEECEDGIDNDEDGLIDYPQDRECDFPQDSPESSYVTECDDGIDNDNDGYIDFIQDPSCTSYSDNSESPFDWGGTQCNDGFDNDGDLFVDYPDEPGCDSPDDNDESPFHSGRTGCTNGVDDDADLFIDFPDDPSCASEYESEWPFTRGRTECSDERDNDNDGATDFPNDFGCNWINDNRESPPTNNPERTSSCLDRIDNDLDGLTDYQEDPGCDTEEDTTEDPFNIWETSNNFEGTVQHREVSIHELEGDAFKKEIINAQRNLPDGTNILALFDEENILIKRERYGLLNRRNYEIKLRERTEELKIAVTTSDQVYNYEIDSNRLSSSESPSILPQRVLLDFNGAENILIESCGGGLPRGPYDSVPFEAALIDARFEGQTDFMTDLITELMREDYADYNVEIYSTREDAQPQAPFSTIYFAHVESAALGLAECVDEYNEISGQDDEAIVYLDSFRRYQVFEFNSIQVSQMIANTASHELGHLLGLWHTQYSNAGEDLMDITRTTQDRTEEEEFMTSALDQRVFPQGMQDAPKKLAHTVGLREE